MNVRDLFIDAVRNADELPALVRDCASSASGVESNSFDRSYLEFLDHQIELNTRGEQWTQRLRARRAGLQDFCDATLLGGRVHVATNDYWIKVDPVSGLVVYWEQYVDC